MQLIELLKGDLAPVQQGAEFERTDIAGLTSDSRRVEPGFLFAALPGSTADGRDFIPDAIGRGAVAVLAPPGTDVPDGTIPLIPDDNPRRRLATLAARFFSEQPATVAAITGTNGKSSVVSFLRQLWRAGGRQAASLGTLGLDAPGRRDESVLTTPDPVDLHRMLSELAASAVDHLAMEASSHGLDQYRLHGVRVTAAAFTNLSRDHLDYHASVENYLDAKLKLFTEVMAPGGAVVINADAPYGDVVHAECLANDHRVLTYGLRGEALCLKALSPTANGQHLSLQILGHDYDVELPLVGGFQAGNALCALGLAIVSGEDIGDTVKALGQIEAVPGRMQPVGRTESGAAVYVDYAHTPDALDSALRALRPHAAGRLIVVFGCGGDRDTGKRPEMGRLAAELADGVIITDDNPRTENAAAIRKQILHACPGGREIGDRADAIGTAIGDLAAGDLLVVAGKGHEKGQIVGEEVLPFNDAEVVRAALEEKIS